AVRKTPLTRTLLLEQDARYQGSSEGYDTIFRFLRACEYGLPQWVSLVQAFVHSFGGDADYTFFVQALSRWFKSEELKNLDEEGIPIQISERFHKGESKEVLVEKLAGLAQNGSNQLS